MRKLYYYTHSLFLLIALATFMSYAYADGKKPGKSDTTKLSKALAAKNDKSYLKNGMHVAFPPLKPNVTIYGTATRTAPARLEPEKVVSNVQVYPNPITDQINLKYMISKNTIVTIKIMDILGNEVVTLFSQHVEPGEQKFTFNLNSKLSSGFYFVRMVAGNESVIKKISIL